MKSRFLADEDFSRKIIYGLLLREPLIDFPRVIEIGLAGKPDAEVLRMAASMGRILVSHDRHTMPEEFGGFIRQNDSPAVLLIPQSLPMRVAIDELQLIWAASDAAEWVNRIVTLPL